MADVTVEQLAKVVGIPVERLLVQLGEAGIGLTSAEETIHHSHGHAILSVIGMFCLKRKLKNLIISLP